MGRSIRLEVGNLAAVRIEVGHIEVVVAVLHKKIAAQQNILQAAPCIDERGS